MSTIDIGDRPFPSIIHVKRGDELRRYVPERTCRMVESVDGECRCGACGHLVRETYRPDKGWHRPVFCAHCGARVASYARD